ncbi:hypothetical protein KXQ82_09700 [Mucilaginibacter sp. HMF5004]|uniref:DUF6434 domain-containing protein n=1 Tax=Mucilaginibacter rivuli TaxID=2857527 RepID=UPI001C5D865B|nr:DUF6434 domain-containing protein [Mucilaginibacter rivuli]MBW4889991.1 hypothetical protein [Mucilaginibacter rivuli]
MDIDWHSHPLTLETRISKSYKNTQNVRRFFRQHISENFHFNREFMTWIKANIGVTLAEVIAHYKTTYPIV